MISFVFQVPSWADVALPKIDMCGVEVDGNTTGATNSWSRSREQAEVGTRGRISRTTPLQGSHFKIIFPTYCTIDNANHPTSNTFPNRKDARVNK